MRAIAVTAVLIVLSIAAPATAQAPRDLRDLVGAPEGGGSAQLERRGFRSVRETSPNPGEDIVYWWNEARGRCISVAVRGGRFRDVQNDEPALCDASTPYVGNSQGNGSRHRGPGYDERQADRMYARGGAITLICYREGVNPNRRGGARDFDGDVRLEIWDVRGRILLAGRDGWRDLENVRTTADRITGRYTANGPAQPRVDIDRRTGRIRIDGAESFRGTCDLGDWNGRRGGF